MRALHAPYIASRIVSHQGLGGAAANVLSLGRPLLL